MNPKENMFKCSLFTRVVTLLTHGAYVSLRRSLFIFFHSDRAQKVNRSTWLPSSSAQVSQKKIHKYPLEKKGVCLHSRGTRDTFGPRKCHTTISRARRTDLRSSRRSQIMTKPRQTNPTCRGRHVAVCVREHESVCVYFVWKRDISAKQWSPGDRCWEKTPSTHAPRTPTPPIGQSNHRRADASVFPVQTRDPRPRRRSRRRRPLTLRCFFLPANRDQTHISPPL